MKGIILAGGKGTRLFPLTKSINKHLLPVGKEPMIYNPIKQLVSADIKDILIITSRENMGNMVNLLGSGREFGCDFTFKVQEEPRGIADALLLGEKFASGDLITVILGDNITTKSIKPYVSKFKKQKNGAKVLLKEVLDPYHFGIATLDKKKIINIQEKPTIPQSNYAVTGIYMYDSEVFDIIKDIPLSPKGELEITTVNNVYIDKGKLTYDFLDGDWIDAGTIKSYKQANEMLYKINNRINNGDYDENTI
ncbi:sugar phosphate nucleotidyltransferase [Caldisalinibacter kiritimatiensis]|uniref:Glucose-1-phosphate thymidylyltransferase n=1 Tax=Caldisalinibacter kiritimatiensis TaxID=1304284 RepID=R1AUH6_9FIRM|nr:sugar phosphate nucleotidyltransferase [Caldisalinibacter kiritimatiensis]EOD00818.1 Glucose-1-phosphate thymidylyltransferase [Caldisalinibacter kiritimatiensis]